MRIFGSSGPNGALSSFISIPCSLRLFVNAVTKVVKNPSSTCIRGFCSPQLVLPTFFEIPSPLRRSKFVGLREDKDPRSMVKEHSGES